MMLIIGTIINSPKMLTSYFQTDFFQNIFEILLSFVMNGGEKGGGEVEVRGKTKVHLG